MLRHISHQGLRRSSPSSSSSTGLSASFTRSLTSAGYIEETIIPTFHFQDSLPKLPVPKLEDTLKRYDYFASPMVSPEEMENTRKAIQEFQQGAGPELQKILEAKDASKYSSFISEPWFNMYLESRDSLMINVNPQLTFKDDPTPEKNTQVYRAGSLIHSSVAFYRTLRDGKLVPDIFHTQPKKSKTSTFDLVRFLPKQVSFYGAYLAGAYPLDMSQYDRLFSSTRVPRKGKDELVDFPESESRHIIVQYGRDFFPVDVLNLDGTSKTRVEIQSALQEILRTPPNKEKPALGALTSMNRDDWADVRGEMEKSSLNQTSLDKIDSALFAVCLEDSTPADKITLSSTMLHGDATNRWFDKSFQLIVTQNGKASINFEHAWGDGVAVLRYFNEVYKESSKDTELLASEHLVDPQDPLKWELGDRVKGECERAVKEAKEKIDSLELKNLETDLVDRNVLKKLGLGVDGFLQMSYQVAYERMYGYTPSTYESASTSAFKHGRTETIRSATPEAAHFAKLMSGREEGGVEAQGAALRKAIDKHGDITKDALMGKGVDRHLFALLDICKREGREVPAIFQDKAYTTLNEVILSTSTLSSDALDAGGFGPVGPKCYGIGYGINTEGAGFAVSSYHRDTQGFVDHLEGSIRDMVDVATKTSK